MQALFGASLFGASPSDALAGGKQASVMALLRIHHLAQMNQEPQNSMTVL